MNEWQEELVRALRELADAQNRIAAAYERGNQVSEEMLENQRQMAAGSAALEKMLIGGHDN